MLPVYHMWLCFVIAVFVEKVYTKRTLNAEVYARNAEKKRFEHIRNICVFWIPVCGQRLRARLGGHGYTAVATVRCCP